MYSVNAKTQASKEKESAGSLSPEVTGLPATLTDSTVSIAQLLEFVNRYYPDIMPKDVYEHFGHKERPAGDLGKSAKYSRKPKAALSTAEKIVERRERALETFGTTGDFKRGGFILPDGRMLNLSEYGLPGVNHNRIKER